MQIHESHLVAGAASQLLFARIDAPRFAKIYSTKGRWSLLDQLLLTAAPATAAAPEHLAAGQPPAAPAAAAKTPGRPTGLSLEAVAQAIRSAAADVLGQDLEGTDSFAAGGFDSLSAVELATSLSTTLGVQLPGTLVFDYPSVSAMAQHVHGLLGPADQAPDAAAEGQLVPASPGHHLAGDASLPISIVQAVRLPTGYAAAGGEAVTSGADGISLVPFARWDLEALRVSLRLVWGVAVDRSRARQHAACDTHMLPPTPCRAASPSCAHATPASSLTWTSLTQPCLASQARRPS